MLLQGLVRGFIGPGPALTAMGVLVGAGLPRALDQRADRGGARLMDLTLADLVGAGAPDAAATRAAGARAVHGARACRCRRAGWRFC